MPDFETVNEALIACVKAAGGSKVVGLRVFPEKTLEAAQRHLLNCLSEGRAERLTPEQVLLIAKLARAKGCHAYAEFMCMDVGYADPQPIEPKDEAAELRRQVLAMGQTLQQALQRLEKLGAA